MKTLKITSWYNKIHFLIPPILFIAYSFKYKIFILFLVLYFLYIIKNKISIKAITAVSIIFASVYLAYTLYTPKFQSIEGIVVEKNEEKGKYVLSSGCYSILFYSDTKYEVGDILRISGDKEIPEKESYEGGFSYYDFLKSKRIYYIYKSPSIKKKSHVIIPQTLREELISYLESRLDSKSMSYVSSLLLGKNTIDDDTKDSISSLGLSHLFAISGYHIMLFFSFLSFILKKVIESERKRNNLIIIFFLFYIVFTNFSISILRASIMIIFMILNKRYNRLFTSLDILSASMILSLIINPLFVYQTSFELTYLITFFLIITRKIIKGKYKAYKISLLAFLSSLPIVINMNYEVNILQILLVPAFSIIIGYILIPYSVLLIFIPSLHNIKIYKMFEGGINIFNKIDITTITFKQINIYFIIVYYILFVMCLIFIECGIKKRSMYIGFISYILFLSFLRVSYPYYRIEFIDVGQGDTAIITLPHNRGVMMIDSFGYNTQYLKSRGIKTIDYVLITHSDNDHIGGLRETINNFNVKTIISSAYDEIEYDSIKVKSGSTLNFKGLNIDVWGPIEDMSSKNNISVVFLINICGVKILFTGDMEKEEEETLVSKYNMMLDADILKVGHHGSDTSSTEEFISKVSPKVSVISVGRNNKYNHPNEGVVSRLRAYSKVYTTAECGNISLIIKNNKYIVKGYR